MNKILIVSVFVMAISFITGCASAPDIPKTSLTAEEIDGKLYFDLDSQYLNDDIRFLNKTGKKLTIIAYSVESQNMIELCKYDNNDDSTVTMSPKKDLSTVKRLCIYSPDVIFTNYEVYIDDDFNIYFYDFKEYPFYFTMAYNNETNGTENDFFNAKVWIAETYNDAKSVIQLEDEVHGTIIGKAMTTALSVKYTFKIIVAKDTIKISFYDFQFSPTQYNALNFYQLQAKKKIYNLLKVETDILADSLFKAVNN